MSSEVLRTENLHAYFFTLNSVVKAVRGISFSLSKGEIIGIVGESGSGKSIVCLSLLKLVPTPGRIVCGKIIIDGENILDRGDDWIRRNIRGRKISMVHQDPLSVLNPTYTVGWQMKEALFLHDQSLSKSSEVQDILIDTLHKMHMPDPAEVLYKYPHQLSGGMRQRVVIATALLTRPSILIADEPTTSLDVTVEARVMDLISELRTSLDLSVVLVSHDLNLITERCDRTLVVYGGLIMESGSSEEVFDHPYNPYTAALIKCIPPLYEDRTFFEPIQGEVIDMSHPPLGCPFHPRCFRKGPGCDELIPELEEIEKGRWTRCHYPL